MSNIDHHPLTPRWWRTAVIYQIYPLSFKDTSGNGRGDLQGIIEKLDYLNGTDESLGIDAIWINPVYPSPKKDHGYDVMDYCNIDPELGDLTVFDRLVEEANKRGIKIVMDYVLNHTSSLHPWFIESRASRDNPKADWYIWRDPKPDGSPPNNWLAVFGGSAWTYDEGRGQYYMHSFLSDQPDLNWRNPEVVEEMKHVFRFWLKRGVSGFRADAVEHLFKDEEFRDEPENPSHNPDTDNPYNALIHTYSRNQTEKIWETIKVFDELLGKDFQNFMVSETWLNAQDLLGYHEASREALVLPLNLNLLHTPWHAPTMKAFIDNYDSLLGERHWPNYVLSNHDVRRIKDRIGASHVRAAALLQLTLRGTPFIYYGAELGMGGAEVEAASVQDPWEKQVPGLGINRDLARTPMQWDDSEHAGFSKVNPWLPVCKNYHEINVKRETEDPSSTLNLYRSLIKIRRESPALTHGRYVPLDSGNENVMLYLREHEEEKMLIMINFADESTEVSFDVRNAEMILSTDAKRNCAEKIEHETVTLLGSEGCLFRVQK